MAEHLSGGSDVRDHQQDPVRSKFAFIPERRVSDVPRWRRIVGTILLIIGCVLVPVSLSAVWVRNTLLDTDNYVATVSPLASDPHVQQAVATRVTDALYDNADVQAKIADALPTRAAFLAEPVANGVHDAIERATLRLAQTDRFETFWERANRRAHEAFVNVLTGGGSRVSTENGAVAVNVGQIVDNVKAKLDAKGITIFDDVEVPADKQQLVIVQSDSLEQVQGLVDLLQTLAWVIPFVALACFAGAIGLSGNRRRTIQRGALGVAFAVAVELALLKAGRNLYLDAVTTKKSTPGAASAVWDQLTSFLRTAGLTTLALALVIAFAAWVVGPSSAATTVRGWWNRALGRSGGDAATAGPVATFVDRNKSVLRGIGVAIAFLVLIAWNHPTALTVLGIGLIVVVYLVILELIGRNAANPAHPASGA
jgi:hypothetical protein